MPIQIIPGYWDKDKFIQCRNWNDIPLSHFKQHWGTYPINDPLIQSRIKHVKRFKDPGYIFDDIIAKDHENIYSEQQIKDSLKDIKELWVEENQLFTKEEYDNMIVPYIQEEYKRRKQCYKYNKLQQIKNKYNELIELIKNY